MEHVRWRVVLRVGGGGTPSFKYVGTRNAPVAEERGAGADRRVGLGFRLVLFRPEPYEFRPKHRNFGDFGVLTETPN